MKLKIRRLANLVRDYLRFGGATYLRVGEIRYGEVLSGKTVLVTGGSAGIGLAIARKCVSEGAVVVITGRNEESLKRAVASVGSNNLRYVVSDVSEISKQEECFRAALDLLGGRLSILVNNAGIHDDIRFPNVSEECWDKVYATNSKGLFFLSQIVSSHWIAARLPGKILNISSSGGFVGATYPYRMTKWDIAGLTQGLGVSLIQHGIIVNGIAPGLTATPMMRREGEENVYASHYPPSYRSALPEEIAELALFLMSDASNYIVGQTIVCDGGYCLKT